MSVSWTNELELQFLENYQAEPVLWNPKHKDYKNKLRINDAWMRISAIMEMEVSDLKKKRDSLLSSYRSYKIKVKKSINAGAEEDDVYKPVWFAYEMMDAFLCDTAKCNKTINTEVQWTDILEDENDPLIEGDLSGMQESEIETPMKSIKSMLKRTNVVKQEKQRDFDDCDLYGQLLAKKLRKMPEEKRHKFMHDIDGMFLRNQYEYQTETHFSPMRLPPSHPSTTVSSYFDSAVHYTPKIIKNPNQFQFIKRYLKTKARTAKVHMKNKTS